MFCSMHNEYAALGGMHQINHSGNALAGQPSPKVLFSFKSFLKVAHFEASVWGTTFGWLGWAGLGWPCRLKKHVFLLKVFWKVAHFEASMWGTPFGWLGLAGLAWPGLFSLEEDKQQEDEEKEQEGKETSRRRRSRPKLYTQTPDQPPPRPLC